MVVRIMDLCHTACEAGSHTAAVMGPIVGGNCGPLSGALVGWQIKQRMLLFWCSSALGLITHCTPTHGTLFIDATHALKCTVTAVGGIVLSHSKKAVEREGKKWFLSLHLTMNLSTVPQCSSCLPST